MEGFKQWLIVEEASMPASAIKIHLPPARQQTHYSCGAACLRSICKYFKVNNDTEHEYIEKLHSDPDDGTKPDDIIRCAQEYGLTVNAKEKMKLADLKKLVSEGTPVICAMQAWGDDYEQYENEESGHYVVAIGFDDEKVYFMDPSMKGARGWLTNDDFIERWHDKESSGKRYIQFGIALHKPGKKKSHRLHKTKEIE